MIYLNESTQKSGLQQMRRIFIFFQSMPENDVV